MVAVGFAKKKKKKGKKKKLTPEEIAFQAEIKAFQDRFMSQKHELQHEKGSRAYFQLERDKLNAFWEITKRDVESFKGELRNKERERDEDNERHQVELKVCKQKLRHLMYEHKIALDRLKIENENALKLQSDEFRQKQAQLEEDKRDLTNEYQQITLQNQEAVKALKLEHEKEMTELRNTFERELKQIQLRYQGKMKDTRERMEEESGANVRRIENHKNAHIRELMEKHQNEFDDIKKYFRGITENNLNLVKQLNHRVSLMKESEVNNEKLMFEIAQSNKNLSEPLMKKLGEVNELRQKLANYQKDKLKLKNCKARLLLIESESKQMKWEKEILFQSFRNLSDERDELYDRYQRVIHDTQQKTMFKNQLLSTKLEALRESTANKKQRIQAIHQEQVGA